MALLDNQTRSYYPDDKQATSVRLKPIVCHMVEQRKTTSNKLYSPLTGENQRIYRRWIRLLKISFVYFRRVSSSLDAPIRSSVKWYVKRLRLLSTYVM
jgi:hypothetical protein